MCSFALLAFSLCFAFVQNKKKEKIINKQQFHTDTEREREKEKIRHTPKADIKIH